MRLSIAIPEAQTVDARALMGLVRIAPACGVETDEHGVLYVAIFEDFPHSVETVVVLIEEAWDLRDIRITLDGRPVVSRTKFYLALLCYRDSLCAENPSAYCPQQAGKIGRAGGCPDRSCMASCQFICARCVGLSHDRVAPLKPVHPLEAAHQPDVDWCPNLRCQDRAHERTRCG